MLRTLNEGIRAVEQWLRSETLMILRGCVTPVIKYNGELIGISLGTMHGRVYQTTSQILTPSSLLNQEGAFNGALVLLESATLQYLFSCRLIDSATAYVLTQDSARSFLELGFKHHDHDEL